MPGNNGDCPPGQKTAATGHKSVVEISFIPSTGELTYKWSGCGFIDAIALLEMAKLHIFNDRLVAQWQAQKGKGDGIN